MKTIKIYRPGGLYKWAWLLCLCLGLILWPATQTAMAQSPANSTVSGTITGNNDVRASTIKSTQIISSGKTAYWAENEIVLNPGFEVKAGATFTANIERDSLHHVKMLTYNLWGNHSEYTEHAKVIKNSGADVVSLQEVRREVNFDKLKEGSGLSGKMCATINVFGVKYGIGMLWNENVVGAPIETKEEVISTPTDIEIDDKKRGFIVAEFNDFCFVATHYGLIDSNKLNQSKAILSNTLVQKCFNNGKPVYIAGDMNSEAKDPMASSLNKLKEKGFTILNNISDTTHRTHPVESDTNLGYIDLILERNTKSYHKTIERGIPIPEGERKYWKDTLKVSDHFPYMVRVKVK